MNQGSQSNNQRIDNLASLQSALHSLIPISAHMGIQAVYYDGNKLVLEAPLSANVNHQQSAFGGSLFSVAVLTGWSIVQLKLGELGINANAVVAGGDIAYSAPVFEDIRCELELPESYPDFVSKLQTTGRGSLSLTSNIFLANETEAAMAFNGKYAVKETS